MRNLSIILLLTLGTGCATVSEPVRQQIRTEAAIGQGVLKKWKTLTPVQQYQAYWKSTRAHIDYNHSINDEPIPAEFAAPDGWVATAPATTATESK